LKAELPGIALRCSFVIVQLLCLSIVQHPLWESQTGLVIGSSSFLAEFQCNSKGRVTALGRGVGFGSLGFDKFELSSPLSVPTFIPAIPGSSAQS